MFSIFSRNEAILTCSYHRASLWLRQERIHLQCRDLCSILGLGGSHREGIGYPIQYSCLENSMDRGAWWATVHGVAKSHDLVTKHSRNSTGKNTGESFAQWQYRSQWGLSEARWLLIEKKKKRILERVAIPSSRVSSWPRDQTHISCISSTGRQILYRKCHPGSPNIIFMLKKFNINTITFSNNQPII